VTDPELLHAARAGDPAALDQLLQRHQAQIYRFGMKMCGNPEDAKDVLQDSLLTAARSLRTFRGESSLSTWLFTIARSFCIKKRRRGKFTPHQQSLDTDVWNETAQVADSRRNPEASVVSKEIDRILSEAISALEPGQREVLVLRDMERLTAPEVATILGIGVDAVKSRLHRARIAVRERVAPALGIAPQSKAAVPAAGPCADVALMFSRHLEGEIDEKTCASMERHLKDCRRCTDVCDSLKQTLSLCRSAGGDDVPADIKESVRRELQAFVLAMARQS
jgi:RNA polymerase sigma-70 factor (ECF subfamily)